ncbi:hypothetical protein K438DRAFT_1771767 [Mycena galopus ATCC 62051]|nr:hypothetical protein K438DRAFT_1771767 [Mycena galopus ATCC 62051]
MLGGRSTLDTAVIRPWLFDPRCLPSPSFRVLSPGAEARLDVAVLTVNRPQHPAVPRSDSRRALQRTLEARPSQLLYPAMFHVRMSRPVAIGIACLNTVLHTAPHRIGQIVNLVRCEPVRSGGAPQPLGCAAIGIACLNTVLPTAPHRIGQIVNLVRCVPVRSGGAPQPLGCAGHYKASSGVVRIFSECAVPGGARSWSCRFFWSELVKGSTFVAHGWVISPRVFKQTFPIPLGPEGSEFVVSFVFPLGSLYRTSARKEKPVFRAARKVFEARSGRVRVYYSIFGDDQWKFKLPSVVQLRPEP